VLVATIWWLLLAAVEALVAGDTAYASAAVREVEGYPQPVVAR
jgi:hypothetical protein